MADRWKVQLPHTVDFGRPQRLNAFAVFLNEKFDIVLRVQLLDREILFSSSLILHTFFAFGYVLSDGRLSIKESLEGCNIMPAEVKALDSVYQHTDKYFSYEKASFR